MQTFRSHSASVLTFTAIIALCTVATSQVKVTTSITVRPLDTILFTAPVSGAGTYIVIWKVNGIVGGNAKVGKVTSSGLYIAPAIPPSPATVRVSASVQGLKVSSANLVTIVQCAPVPTGLVSWWAGENGAQDVYGSNTGTLEGGTSFVPGKVALGFSFDGSTGYINIPDSSSLDSISTAISVEMWALPQPIPSSETVAYLFARRNPIYSEGFSIYILADGTLGVILRTTSSPTPTGSKFESAPGAVTFGQMQHIAVTVNTNTSVVAAYIDGEAVPLTVVYGPSTFSGTFSPVPYLYLGRREDFGVGEGVPGAAYFPGILDEVSLYSAELSQTQIASIVAVGLNGKCR
jgi:hypothetical protein